MQDSEILDLIEADHKRIDRKYATDPSYILRKRVANTAGDVIRKIQNITENMNFIRFFTGIEPDSCKKFEKTLFYSSAVML